METEMNPETRECRGCGGHFNVSSMKDDGETYTCSSCRENSEED